MHANCFPAPASIVLCPSLQPLGAIIVGKTNMDQFAAGLVGTRSPYGVAANSWDVRFIPGGSSSGSAAAVGARLVTFALGTDTAGSGRVPAGLNGIVGIKGTVGKVSTQGEGCWRAEHQGYCRQGQRGGADVERGQHRRRLLHQLACPPQAAKQQQAQTICPRLHADVSKQHSAGHALGVHAWCRCGTSLCIA